jgi:hypothetical protein
MKKYKSVHRQVLALILVFTLVWQMVLPVSANIANTIHNTPQQNQTILEKLRGTYGSNFTATDVAEELKNMGLLDADGNLSVSQNIMVDGTPMTLDQVRAMLAKQGTDLNKTVSVDGTAVTLASLKTMIEIEDELSRLKKTYFTGAVPFDAQREKMYASLASQLQTEGLSLQNSYASGAFEQNIYIKITDNGESFRVTPVYASGNQTGFLHDVSFKWRLLQGSFSSSSPTFGTENTVTMKMNEYPKTVSCPKGNSTAHYSGDAYCILQVYDPNGSLFRTDSGELTRSLNIPINIPSNYTWTTQISFNRTNSSGYEYLGTVNEPAVLTNFYVEPGKGLKAAAADIFGDTANARYHFKADMQLNVSSNGTATTMTAKPRLMYGENYNERKFYSNDEYSLDGVTYQSFNQTAFRNFGVGRETPGAKFTIDARVQGDTPSYLAFTSPTYNPKLASSDYTQIPNQYYYNGTLSIYDNQSPSVKAITASAGSYYTGQQVPITVEFTEPVTGAPTLTMKDGTTVLNPQESSATKSKYRMYLYTVPVSPDPNPVLGSVNSITDMAGNTTAEYTVPGTQKTLSSVSMVQDKLQSFSALSVDSSATYPYNGKIKVTLTAKAAYKEWLSDEAGNNGKELRTFCLFANNGTGDKTFALKAADESGLVYTAEINAADYLSLTDTTLDMGLLYNPSYDSSTQTFSGGSKIFGLSCSAKIAAIYPVTGVTIAEPENHTIYRTATDAATLTASVTPPYATFKTVTWKSSNEQVATIQADAGNPNTAVITLAPPGPNTPNTVYFTATATNGGMGDPIIQKTSDFTVSNDGIPAIVFAKGSGTFYTKKNESVKVFWGQNLIARKGSTAQPVFSVKVYEGQHTLAETNSLQPKYEQSVTNQSSCTIPENKLNVVSTTDAKQNKVPAYTVRVSAPNPDNPSQTLSAAGYIIVYPQPLKVSLNTLSKYSITDEAASQQIGWNISNLESSGQMDLKILKNGQAVNVSGFTHQTAGSFSLPISKVSSELKDIYTVTLSAKNPTDSSWSSDSFVLNVYKGNSMKLMVDDKETADNSLVSLDNEPLIKSKFDAGGSESILQLNREIGLKKSLSINSEAYPWGNITDRILWKSGNSGAASVNYRQGSLYENIEKFNYLTYSPLTKFMLAGNGDGSSQITATHAPTGMQQTLNVSVKTLKDKLYIFNLYPKLKTTVTFENGLGQSRKLATNDNGEIAVYEPSGIKSDVSFQSGSGTDTYVGTVFHDDLKSAEGNPGYYERYPVNILQLRPVTTLNLYFKNSDGTPYTGAVTYGGAVFRNGEECSRTQESNKAMTLGSQGNFQLHFDSTEFTAGNNSQPFKASDKLTFIYEVRFANDSYYPQLITADGSLNSEDIVRFGDSVVNLKEVPSGGKNKPFIVSQAIDYHLASGRKLDVTNYAGGIGPGNLYPSTDLVSTVAWWGISSPSQNKSYGLEMQDEYGAVIPGQKVKTLNYPFAAMSYTENTATMSPASLNLSLGAKKGAATALYLSDGTLYSRIQNPFSFTNMVGAVDANDKDSGVNHAFSDLKKSGMLGFNTADLTGSILGQIGSSDGTLLNVVKLLNSTSIGPYKFNMSVTATNDPMIFRGLITVSAKEGEDTNIDIGGADENIDLPGVSQLAETAKNKTDIKNQFTAETSLKSSGGFEWGMSVAGYYEVEARYDPSAAKWKMTVTGGGADIGSMVGYTKCFNTTVYGIPITAEFGGGAQMNLAFRAAKPSDSSVPEGVKASDVNDFFTMLRINLYVKAFGGFGFDYEIVALKIGIFGQVDLGFNNENLNRSYLTENQKLSSISASLYGTAGIKFVAKLLFLSYSTVLASFTYGGDLFTKDAAGTDAHTKIKKWKSNQTLPMPEDPEQGFSYGFLGGRYTGNASGMSSLSSSFMRSFASSGLQTVQSSAALESRDYLGAYTRSWPTRRLLRAVDSPSTLSNIESNAYPYSNPVVTRDGKVLAYLSDSSSTDVNNTRASWGLMGSNDLYEDKKGLSTDTAAGPDSSLSLDGTSGFAVAAWTRQGTKITAAAGQTLSESEVSAMTNSTKVMASVYSGGSWMTSALTDENGDNLTADLAPVVAANGNNAIVAWRSTAGSSMEAQSLDYSGVSDRILYRTYANGAWGDTKVLYNGSTGSVKGLVASMLDDGTAGLAYTVNCGSDKTSSEGWETFSAVVHTDGSIAGNLRLTNNSDTDDNPQIAAVNFGTDASKDQKFVLGWHTSVKTTDAATNQESSSNDIRLAAVNKDGTPCSDFTDSLSSIGDSSAVAGSGSFRFAKGDGLKLDDLSLIWVQAAASGSATNTTGLSSQSGNKDSLKAVKFMKDGNGKIYLTGALDVAEMPDYNKIDHFDAYYESAGQKVRAVMLASDYNKGALQTITTTDGRTVSTKGAVCSMKSATAVYTNTIDVQDVRVNYSELKSGFRTTIPFTVENKGVQTVSSATITVGGKNQTYNDLNLLPNQKITLSCDYDVPVSIHDVSYTVSAAFSGGTVNNKTGTLNLDLPDTGVSRLELVGDEQGKRIIQATLQNISDVPLSGSSRKVYVGLFTSPECTLADKNGNALWLQRQEITGDNLKLLDESALTVRFTYNLPVDGIPSGGTRLYSRIWVEEQQPDSSYDELVENNTTNDSKSILIANPLEANNGNPIRITVDQDNSSGVSVANLTVKNLTMSPVTNGNVAAELLDSEGNVLETKLLTYNSSGLLNLGGEESVKRQISFTRTGAKIVAQYFTANTGSGGISSITAQGIGMVFDSGVHAYSLEAMNLPSTVVMAAASNPNEYVIIKDSGGTRTLAQSQGAASYTMALPDGSTQTVQVLTSTTPPVKDSGGTQTMLQKSFGTAQIFQTAFAQPAAVSSVSSGSASNAYTLTISSKTSTAAGGTVSLQVLGKDTDGEMRIQVNASGLSGFTPAKWQYTSDGGKNWSGLQSWDDSSPNVFVLNKGNYSAVQARVLDASGTAMTSNAISVSSTGKILKSLTGPSAISGLPNGTAKTAQALGLPDTVTAVTDCSTENIPVVWNVGSSSYNPSSSAAQTFNVKGTAVLPAGILNSNGVSLSVGISVTVSAKSSETPSNRDTKQTEQKPVSSNFTSDTTADLSVQDSYQFRITSANGRVPSFVLGTPGVFSVQMIRGGQNEFFFRVSPIGRPGSRTGVYLDGKTRLLVLTVAPVQWNGTTCDTLGMFDVQEGKTYQFKVVSDRKPVLMPGSGSFRLLGIRQNGKEWYFRFSASGRPGESCGFYLDRRKTPVAIANIK